MTWHWVAAMENGSYQASPESEPQWKDRHVSMGAIGAAWILCSVLFLAVFVVSGLIS